MRTLTAVSLAATLVLAGTTVGQSATAPSGVQSAAAASADGRTLTFSVEEVEFGQIDDSKVVEKTVTLTNTGGDVMRIPQEDGVKASCGCTVPGLPKYELQPGESIEMTVRFDPRKREGHQRKTITIRTEDSNSQYVLPVNGFVVQRVQVVEGLAQFGNVDQGDETTIEIHVRGMSSDFEVTEVIPSRDDMFGVKILGTEIVQREDPITSEMTDVGETTIAITLKSTAPIGRTDGKLTIRTNDPIAEEKEVRTIASITGDVRVDPAVVRLGAVEAGSSFEHTINVFSNKAQPFNIERVLFITSDMSEADKALVSTSYQPLAADDGRVGYTVTFKGDVSDTMRIIRGRLVIVTDAPGQRVISANVAGVVRSQ